MNICFSISIAQHGEIIIIINSSPWSQNLSSRVRVLKVHCSYCSWLITASIDFWSCSTIVPKMEALSLVLAQRWKFCEISTCVEQQQRPKHNRKWNTLTIIAAVCLKGYSQENSSVLPSSNLQLNIMSIWLSFWTEGSSNTFHIST